MTLFVEIFSILAPKPLYIKMQSLFFTFKLVTKSPFLSSDVRVVLRPSPTWFLALGKAREPNPKLRVRRLS